MIHATNYSDVPFHGWLRTTTDHDIPPIGRFGDTPFMRGGRVGQRAHIVDLYVALGPGERRSFALDSMVAWTRPAVPMPDIAALGNLTCGGKEMMLTQWFKPDGAALSFEARCRIGRMFVVDLSLRWYPETPWQVTGTARATASNTGIPDMTALAPDTAIAWGDAIVWVFGRGDARLANPGESWGDAQSRILPVTMGWLHLLPPERQPEAMRVAERWILAGGLQRLYPYGNPRLPPGFVPDAWAQQHYKGAKDALSDWRPMLLGVNSNSGVSGAQEDQVWHGEAML